MPDASAAARKSMKFVPLTFLLLAVMPPAKAESIDDRALKAYQLGESDARKQLDDALEAAKVEERRKAMAGEPPITAKMSMDGTEAIKFLIYNRAATNGICFAAALTASANFDALQSCVEKRNVAMVKFLKLGEYAKLPSSRTHKDCELLGRDFDAERRFPPFDFLRVRLGPPILNFEAVNDCLMSDH